MADDETRKQPAPTSGPTLSAQQAAQFLGISEQRLGSLRRWGRIPAIREGWLRYRYRERDLLQFAENVIAERAASFREQYPPTPWGEPSKPLEVEQGGDEKRFFQIRTYIRLSPPPLDSDDIYEESEQTVIARLANAILVMALDSGASDIHFDPYVYNVHIRIRVDGLLTELTTIPRHLQAPVFNRYKVMADLNPFAHHLQTGHIPIKHGRELFELQLSSVPSVWRETLVLSIFRHSDIHSSLDAAGFSVQDQETLRSRCRTPGLLLFVAPPGSGTTTTAYRVLRHCKTIERNILSFESLPTYRLPGVTQTYADPRQGVTHRTAVPAFFEQDPDLLFLGDIDDPEAAEAAVRAAERGIPVWATLHASDALHALWSLKSLGIAPERIARTIHTVGAQRLVRRLCPECREPVETPVRNLTPFGFDPDDVHNPRRFPELPPDRRPEDPVTLYKGAGCDACNGKGYKDRLGIFEILPMTEEIGTLLAENAASSERRQAALYRTGMTTLRQDALRKVLAGVCSLDEAYWATV